MMKRKKKHSDEDIQKFKRKRGRILQRRLARPRPEAYFTYATNSRNDEAYISMALPIIFANIARQYGDFQITPSDFTCGCSPCFVDGGPICENRKPDCRYTGNWTYDSAKAAETKDRRFHFHNKWRLTTMRMFDDYWPAFKRPE